MSATTTKLLSSGEFCKLRYDTIPVQSASADVYLYTNNSKMPNFELWHSCRKRAIYSLLFLAWDNDRPTWDFFFRVGWCVVLWTLEMQRTYTTHPPPSHTHIYTHTHTHTNTHTHTHTHTHAHTLRSSYRISVMFVGLHQTEKAVQFLINIAVPNYLQEDILSTVLELLHVCRGDGRTDGGCNRRFAWMWVLLKVRYYKRIFEINVQIYIYICVCVCVCVCVC